MSVLLCDGNNMLMRSIHAMQRPGQARLSADGVATGPLLVFVNMLSKHIREEKPDKVVVAWDGGKSEHRVALDPDYKGQRTPSPDFEEFKEGAFGLAKEFLSLANVHHIEVRGYEADDVIAYYWRHHRPLDDRLVILSSDKSETPFFISRQDEALVQQRTWRITSDGYVQNATNVGGRFVGTMLHREIMGLTPDDPRSVDHRDGNPLNNTRGNLRILTHAQNQQNRSDTKDWGHSSHRGVSWNARKQKWTAYGYLNGKQHHIGYFEVESQAAEAAQTWRAEHMPYADRDQPPQERLVILSSDKDFLMLLGESPGGYQVEQVRLGSYDTPTDRWTHDRVVEEMGCKPSVLTDAMALAGDTSDNVPGVPRYGMKTAIKTLARYKWSLHDALAFEEKLQPHRERVALNRRLVDLRDGTPGLSLDPLPPFQPTAPGHIAFGPLLSFLTRYQLESVKSRLYDNSLWK